MIIDWNWEEYDIPKGTLHDLATRHWSQDQGMYFRPTKLNVLRSPLNGSVIIAKFQGPRVIGGSPDITVLDDIEFDVARDFIPYWVLRVLESNGLTMKVRPVPVGPYEKLMKYLQDFDDYQAEQIPDGDLEADPKDGYDSWDERTAEYREYIHFEVLDLLQTLGLRKTGRETVKL